MNNNIYLITMDFRQIIESSSFLDPKYINLKHLDTVEVLSEKIDYSTPYGITNDKSIRCKLLRTGQEFTTHYPWLLAQNTEQNYHKIVQLHIIDKLSRNLNKQRKVVLNSISKYITE